LPRQSPAQIGPCSSSFCNSARRQNRLQPPVRSDEITTHPGCAVIGSRIMDIGAGGIDDVAASQRINTCYSSCIPTTVACLAAGEIYRRAQRNLRPAPVRSRQAPRQRNSSPTALPDAAPARNSRPSRGTMKRRSRLRDAGLMQPCSSSPT